METDQAGLVHKLLEDSADNQADNIALVHGEKSWSYQQIDEQANQLAHFLIAQGVKPGDRVGLMCDNGIEAVVGIFGILKSAACVVAMTSANKAHTNRKILEDSGAVALVTRALQVRRDFADLCQDPTPVKTVLLDRVDPRWQRDGLKIMAWDSLGSHSTSRPNLPIESPDLCSILYTSGSTGTPRGVTLTHRNLWTNTQQILAYLELHSQDSVLSVLPFHYSFGYSLLLTHFAVGGRVVVDNRFAYPQSILETMKEQKVTSFSGVPSTYAILCANTGFLELEFPHLRMLTQAGGGMAPSLVKKIKVAFEGRAQLFVMYGQTEASARLAYLPPDRLDDKPGSIGIAIPGVSLDIFGNNGVVLPPGEVGELVARGDNIMSGYWQAPEETSLVLKNGALWTGDLGKKDDEGFIFLVDRIKNMIKAGANRVSSREVEDTLSEIDDLVEVCVIGVPDELMGEAIEAHLVLSPGSTLTNEEILVYLNQRLAPYKIPRELLYHKELPKNTSGKLNRSKLKKIV